MGNLRKNDSEVTAVVTLTLTDIFKVSNNIDKVDEETNVELERLIETIRNIPGVDHLEINKTKVFPNVKA
jgi:uncharacterized protein YgfB (UPF0149 family)